MDKTYHKITASNDEDFQIICNWLIKDYRNNLFTNDFLSINFERIVPCPKCVDCTVGATEKEHYNQIAYYLMHDFGKTNLSPEEVRVILIKELAANADDVEKEYWDESYTYWKKLSDENGFLFCKHISEASKYPKALKVFGLKDTNNKYGMEYYGKMCAQSYMETGCMDWFQWMKENISDISPLYVSELDEEKRIITFEGMISSYCNYTNILKKFYLLAKIPFTYEWYSDYDNNKVHKIEFKD